jgi:hypothetical protein
VVVLGTVCSPVAGESGEAIEGPWHVHFDRPLGEWTVFDGCGGEPVPYKNVYEEIQRRLVGGDDHADRVAKPKRRARSR